jgi:2-polyprenyl-6-hydroxyphenyl methylase / 3-demethylubiquinone-9 3-methyltransferase
MVGHEQFDSIMALEIIEHVNNPSEFIQTLTKLLKPNGWLFLSTINRTLAAKVLTIYMAEHVLNWVPVGTHSFDKYITPGELTRWTLDAGLSNIDIKGMEYNIVTKQWSLTENTDVNYIMACRLNPTIEVKVEDEV